MYLVNKKTTFFQTKKPFDAKFNQNTDNLNSQLFLREILRQAITID